MWNVKCKCYAAEHFFLLYERVVDVMTVCQCMSCHGTVSRLSAKMEYHENKIQTRAKMVEVTQGC